MSYKITNNTCDVYCTRHNGLFSNFFEVINTLHELELTNVNFNKLNILNFSTNYSNTKTNSFYDFFDICNNPNIIIDKLNCGLTVESFITINGIETCDIFTNNDKIKYINSLLRKYIQPQTILKQEIDNYWVTNFKGKKILGVHVRRTDHEGHGKFVDINKYIQHINKIINSFDNLFIITDSESIITLFKEIYGDKLLFVNNITRSVDNIAIHYSDNDKYKIGCDVVIETFLLGMCDKIIGTSSNVLMFGICNQEKNNHIMLDLNTTINKDIVFYNNFHNGDLHYSREFIKDIYIKTKDNYNDYYNYHKFDNSEVLLDIEKTINKAYLPNLPDNRGFYDDGRTIFINTWIGHNNMQYLIKSCSLFSNYHMFETIYNRLNIKLEPIEYYIPKIEFDMYNQEYLNNIDLFFKNTKGDKNILISNGNVNSGQAINFDFSLIINTLANDFKSYNFICTSNTFATKSNNIFFSDNIIMKHMDDLNEIGYLSKYCDVIIGRASGPYCFTHIKENINNENKKYISFSKVKNEGVWYEGKAKNIWSNDFNINNIINIIKQEL